ncbi:MAG: thiamine diphosphokinase [Aliishimia sp.]
MISEIVFDANPVTLVGAGVVYPDDLDRAQTLAPQVIAADGGATQAIAAGLMPKAVIGDFDSLDVKTRAALPPESMLHVSEQDSTDFEKALMRIAAPLVIGVGFTGGRLDHTFAALHGMLRFQDKPVVLIAEHEVILLAPPRLELSLPANAVVSLFPLIPVQGRSTGLVWPIDGLKMVPGQVIGTSNKAVGGPLKLEMDGPGMALFLPKSELAQVTQALLLDAPEHVRWPAQG